MPRIDSPRRRERRTRSRSYSPRPSFSRRRSGSRSPREARRSRSPEWRQSPRRRSPQGWKQRSRSPQRQSRSPQRRSRSPQRRSRSPQRRSRSLSYERSQPVKRVAAADSSGKRVSSYRSRSPSPVHAKRARDDREYREPRRDDRRYSPVRSQERDYSPRRRSPRGRSPSPRRVSRGRSPSPPKASRGRSPSPRYSGKLYSDKASSSRAPEKKRDTISSVTIPMKNRLEKLDKRFQTLEQISRGAFDFEENITIGIHRGPHHVNLDDEDIEVNYDFNPKTFLMLFPKKETFKAIFDRDEILQFHHDDILDEEAYVEKRTITVKPTDKPKPKWSDSVDYKITIGGRSSRAENYDSDRRMVRDSGRRRSSRDREPEVTVRLDPKPDPRYERLFRASERRGEDRDEMIRDPHDLRHSLNKRHRDGYESDEGRDRDRSRERDRGRSRDGERDRGRDREREDRIVVQDARRKIEARRSIQGGSLDRAEIQITKTERREMRRSVERLKREKGRASLEKELPDFKNRPVEPLIKPNIWIIGTSVVKDVAKEVSEGPTGKNLGLDEEVASIYWHGEADMTIKDILAAVTFMMKKYEQAQMIIIQCGDNDICEGINSANYHVMQKDLKVIQEKIPGVRLVWSQLLPPWNREDVQVSSLNKSKRRINRYMVRAFYDFDGCYLRHPNFTNDVKMQLFRSDTDNYMHLSELGTQQYVAQLREGIKYFIAGMGNLFPYIETWPPENNTMQSLHPNQIPCLSYLQIRDLTKNLIKSMTPEQIAKLTGEQIEWLGPNQLTHMNIHTIKAFTPAQVPCFSRRQIMQFQLKQLELFSKEQIQNCTDNQKSLIIDQMKVKIQEEADIRSLVPIDMVPIDMVPIDEVSPIPCLFFKRGRCQRGADCKFTHDLAKASQRPPIKRRLSRSPEDAYNEPPRGPFRSSARLVEPEENRFLDRLEPSSSRRVDQRLKEPDGEIQKVWVFGTGEMKDLRDLGRQSSLGTDLGLLSRNIMVYWYCKRGMKIKDILPAVHRKIDKGFTPKMIVLHCGGNDLGDSSDDIEAEIRLTVDAILNELPEVKIVWSMILPRWLGRSDVAAVNRQRDTINERIARFVLDSGGCYLRYPSINLKEDRLYRESHDGDIILSTEGQERLLATLKGGIVSILLRNVTIAPELVDLEPLVEEFVKKNIKRGKFGPLKRNFRPVVRRRGSVSGKNRGRGRPR